jgi:hypothetical protein
MSEHTKKYINKFGDLLGEALKEYKKWLFTNFYYTDIITKNKEKGECVWKK